MSLENHPNIHAVGMTIDVTDIIRKRLRGDAAEKEFGDILPELSDDIQDFVLCISCKLDKMFPENKN